MFDLLKMDVAVFLALAWLLMGLFLPVIALWFLVRVTRDLRRIADAVESPKQFLVPQETVDLCVDDNGEARITRRVANSMFGR